MRIHPQKKNVSSEGLKLLFARRGAAVSTCFFFRGAGSFLSFTNLKEPVMNDDQLGVLLHGDSGVLPDDTPQTQDASDAPHQSTVANDGIVGDEFNGAYYSTIPKATAVFKQIYHGHKLPEGHPATGRRPRTVGREPFYKIFKKDDVFYSSPVGEPIVGFSTGEGVPEGAKAKGWVVTVLHAIRYENEDPCPGEENCFGFYRSSYGVFVHRDDVAKFVHKEFRAAAFLHWRGCEDREDVEEEIRAKTAFDKEWKGGYFEVTSSGWKPPQPFGAVITIEPAKVKAVMRWEALV